MTDCIVDKAKERIDFVSWIQFIGVICVIAGHSINELPVPEIFIQIKYWIYTFHMPLFFLVSAFLFSYKGGFEKKGYKSVFLNRFIRLIIPYVIWNLLFFIPKVLLKDYISDEVEISGSYFLEITLYPRNTILGHTWFLFALFEMFVLAIFFELVKKRRILWIPLTIVLVVLYCFGVQERFLAVGDLMKNAFYFWIGLLLGTVKIESLIKYGKDKFLFIACALLVIGLSVVWAFFPNMLINTMLLGLSILIFLCLIQIQLGFSFRYMNFVSKNCFPIYILHWPIMMLIRLLIYTKLSWNPILVSAILLACGLAIPSLIVWVLRMNRIKWLNSVFHIVLGM